MLEPAVESLPWSRQRAEDDARWRRQLAWLFERSRFYRAKFAAAGISGAADAGGLDDIAALPFTEKAELRATVTAD
jgi:phenylacetate-CoA ligase